MKIVIQNTERKVSFTIHNIDYCKLRTNVIVIGSKSRLDSTDYANLKSYCEVVDTDDELKISNLKELEIDILEQRENISSNTFGHKE